MSYEQWGCYLHQHRHNDEPSSSLTWSSSWRLWTVRVLPSVSSSISIPSVMKIGSWSVWLPSDVAVMIIITLMELTMRTRIIMMNWLNCKFPSRMMIWNFQSLPCVQACTSPIIKGEMGNFEKWHWWKSILSNLVFLPEDVRARCSKCFGSELENIFTR